MYDWLHLMSACVHMSYVVIRTGMCGRKNLSKVAWSFRHLTISVAFKGVMWCNVVRPASDLLAPTQVDLFVWFFRDISFLRFLVSSSSFDCLFFSSRLARIRCFNNTSSYDLVVGGVIETILISEHIQLSRRK